jgi:putative chitinase
MQATRPIDWTRLYASQGCTAQLAQQRGSLAATLFSAITDADEAALLIARCGHETKSFKALREDMTYKSATRIREIYPSVSAELAQHLIGRPQALANQVYARRFGNGGPDSNDGWLYRGGGDIQLTFRANYRDCGAATGLPLEARPELVERPEIAIRVARWFWASRGCGELARQGQLRAAIGRINPALKGWDDTMERYARARAAIGA